MQLFMPGPRGIREGLDQGMHAVAPAASLGKCLGCEADGYHHFEHHCLVTYSVMKIAKCPSIVLKLVDDELSKVEYGVLQKGKSLSLAIVLGLIVLIIKYMEGG